MRGGGEQNGNRGRRELRLTCGEIFNIGRMNGRPGHAEPESLEAVRTGRRNK